MPDKELTWRFSEDLIVEPETIVEARHRAIEVGADPLPPSMGAQLAVLAAASRAESIIEIGTGAGVSGLWMLHGAPTATLTSIDTEVDHQQLARTAFTAAGIPANRVRLIAGKAANVLPRMNENSYDLVVVDADWGSVIEYVEHGLRLARVGGTVVVVHALWRDRVANPTARDEAATIYRTLLQELKSSPAVICALSPVGDGLLQVTKLSD